MSSAESPLLHAVPAPDEWVSGRFDARSRSRAHVRALSDIGKRSLGIHLLMVIALALLWMVIQTPELVLVAGGIVFLVGCVLIAMNEARATPLMITPLSWWFAWQAFTLGLAPIWIGSRLSGAPLLEYVGQELSIDNVAEGFLYFAVGSLAMHFGLQRARPKELVTASNRPASIGSLGAIIILSACGVVYAFFGSRINAIGSLIAPLQWGALSAACSLAIAPPRSMPARSPVYWYAVVLATAVCVISHAVIGLKFLVMISALPLVWIFMIGKNPKKTVTVLVAALALSYVYMVQPVVDGLRAINHSADIRDSLITNAEGGTLSDIANLDKLSLDRRVDKIMEREFSGLYVGFLVQDTKAFGFRMGATMDYLLYAFIPRIFWPEKPNVSRGAWFTTYLGAADSEDTANSASALTAEGELYWNFGIPGLVMGMAFLGWLVGRLLWQTAGADPRVNPVRMLALITTIFLVAGELEAGTMLVGIVTDAIVLRVMLLAYGSLSERY